MSEARAEAERRHVAGELYDLSKSRLTTFEEGARWAVERAAQEAERGYLYSESCDDIAARIRALVADVEPPKLIECPHWAPGTVTIREGCTACESESTDPSSS